MNRRTSSRLEALRADKKKMERRVLTYCLDPTGTDELVAWTRLHDDDNYDLWRRAIEGRHKDEATLLINSIESSPRQSSAVKLMYLFCATGTVAYIMSFYEIMGHKSLPHDTRKKLCGVYYSMKEIYTERIGQLLAANPLHFTELGIIQQNVDFSLFDGIEKVAEDVKEKNKLFLS